MARMRLAKVTPLDLEAYVRSPESVSFSKAEAMYVGKRWITGVGNLTEQGDEILRRLNRLGPTVVAMSRSKRDALRAVERGSKIDPRNEKTLEELGLVRNGDVTHTGRELLDLFSEE